jgi:hypothetical protein
MEHPNIYLLFVPANCTSIFQVADVGLQRIIKHHLSQAELNWFVDAHAVQLESGKAHEEIEFTKSLPVLHDATVKPLVEVFKWLRSYEGQQVIKHANELCKVDQWNLTGEMLTSPKARAALRRYLQTDDVLRKEIEGKLGAGCLDLEDNADADIGEESEEQDLDDTDVPLTVVIRDALGLDT